MKYFGIYKITNLLDGKMYIGQHTTEDLDDGYMGSGLHLKRSLKRYGLENFRKEWLMFCEDEEELNYMERVFVDQTWVDRADTYNIALGGKKAKFSEQYRQHLSYAAKKCQNRQSVKELKSKFQKEYKNRPDVKQFHSNVLKKWRSLGLMKGICLKREIDKGIRIAQKNGQKIINEFYSFRDMERRTGMDRKMLSKKLKEGIFDYNGYTFELKKELC